MKYIHQKIINGHAYYYLQYQSYSKSLGPYLPTDLSQQLIDFFQDIGARESQEKSSELRKIFKYGNVKLFEELKYFHIVLKHDLAKVQHDAAFKKLAILFTFHSNRSEGSQTTKKEVFNFSQSKIRKPQTKTQQELLNSFEAFEYIISEKMKWNAKSIRQLHAILLKGIDPLIAGQWKKENNIVGQRHTTDHKKVSGAMKNLLEWLQTSFKNKQAYPPEIALQFYIRFEAIHPFDDGNGRVGRLLLNAILYKFNYPPVIFFSENHQEHCAGIDQALKGRPQKFYKHFLKQVEKTNQEVFRWGV